MEKKFTLAANPTKKSEQYFKALQDLSQMRNTFEARRQAAESELESLKKELDGLSSDMMLETDPGKLQAISDKRKDLRYKIEDLQTIVQADINSLIRAKHGDLVNEPFVREAQAEWLAFRGLIEDEVKRIQEESEAKIKELQAEKMSHPLLVAQSLSDNIAMSSRR